MHTIPRITVRLTDEQLRRLDGAAAARGRPRAELIRDALDHFFDGDTRAKANSYRLAQTTEFVQIVTDLIVSRDMPDKRSAILAEVAQRLEQFHGSV